MAQSHDGSIIDDHDLDVSFERADLPEGEARLVIHEDDVTTIIQGDRETVNQRLYEQLAEDFNTTVEDLAAVDEYPMPNGDEGIVPADEFYGEDSAE